MPTSEDESKGYSNGSDGVCGLSLYQIHERD